MNKHQNPAFDVEGAQAYGGIGTGPVKGEEFEDDLPITANRSAKWWYIAVHNITAMVGAGVLGLPYAMGLLGVLLLRLQLDRQRVRAITCNDSPSTN